jgi:hypothetical protein
MDGLEEQLLYFVNLSDKTSRNIGQSMNVLWLIADDIDLLSASTGWAKNAPLGFLPVIKGYCSRFLGGVGTQPGDHIIDWDSLS